MRYYETLYIVNPNYEQDRLDKVKQEVEEHITGNVEKVINHRVWGKKRLAYPVQKQKYGTFMLVQFEASLFGFLPEFDQFMRLNKAVLRHQTVVLNERPDEYVEEVTEAEDTEIEGTDESDITTVKEDSITESEEPKNENLEDRVEDESEDKQEKTEQE